MPFSRFSLITYPAVPLLILFSLTLLCPYPAFRLPLTLLCPYFSALALQRPAAPYYFIFTYPAVPLFFCTYYSLLRTLLRPYFFSTADVHEKKIWGTTGKQKAG